MESRSTCSIYAEMVDFPIRKRHFRVRGWSGAFWEPLERKKRKTKCIYKICIPLHRFKSRKFCKISSKFYRFFRKFCKICIFSVQIRRFFFFRTSGRAKAVEPTGARPPGTPSKDVGKQARKGLWTQNFPENCSKKSGIPEIIQFSD